MKRFVVLLLYYYFTSITANAQGNEITITYLNLMFYEK